MRATSVVLAILMALLLGCSSTKASVDAEVDDWKRRITSEVPTGTDAAIARGWFERQGLIPQANVLKKSNEKDFEVHLSSVPAREWNCEKWVVRVIVKVSVQGKVAAYDFDALGVCL